MSENLRYRCCFCDQMIESTRINPCDLNILINYDKPKDEQDNQTFWCHIECFRKSLHENIRKMLVVDILD
jgi:hypothetical protein